MGSWPMDGSINLSASILDLSSPSSLSVSGSTKKREERGKMLQLNSVSRVSSSPQNPKLWLPQYNSLCSPKSISLNSKTSSTEKKETLGVKCQYYDQQHKTFTTSSRPSPSSGPPGSFYLSVFHFWLVGLESPLRFIIYLSLLLLYIYIYIVGESPPKVFVGHSIYKGKAALTVEPRSPEFSPLDVSPLLFSSNFRFLSLFLSFFSSLYVLKLIYGSQGLIN
jgi:hypothetical protein